MAMLPVIARHLQAAGPAAAAAAAASSTSDPGSDPGSEDTLQVFVLMGQSNMAGRGDPYMGGACSHSRPALHIFYR
jgi:hypothetical protein